MILRTKIFYTDDNIYNGVLFQIVEYESVYSQFVTLSPVLDGARNSLLKSAKDIHNQSDIIAFPASVET